MTDSVSELRKSINRFAELQSKKFVKIPNKVIELEKIVSELEEDLAEENIQPEKNIVKIQLLESRLIQRKRDLIEAKKNIK